jgi:hypothetical protein
MRELVILVLLVSLFFVSARLIHVENQRYAMITGLCKFDSASPTAIYECLRNVRTRDSILWHLYYALTD